AGSLLDLLPWRAALLAARFVARQAEHAGVSGSIARHRRLSTQAGKTIDVITKEHGYWAGVQHGFDGSGHCRQLFRVSIAASISGRSKGQDQIEIHAHACCSKDGRRDAGVARTGNEAGPNVEFADGFPSG